MKDLFDIFGFIALKKKVLLVVTLIFSMIASGLMMYEKNLSVTINGSYDSLPEGVVSYLYKIPRFDNVISVDESTVRDEVTYHSILKQGTTFSYNTYLNTSATISKINNKELATNLDFNGNPPASGYKVKVLFVDQATIAGTDLEAVMNPLFNISTDYDRSVPCILGSKWQNEKYNLGSDAVSIKTTINNYNVVPYSYLPEGTSIKPNRTEIKLDDYIIIPLIDLDNGQCKFPEKQSGLERWHNIYSIMISGYIKSDKSANAIQKELFSLVKASELELDPVESGVDVNIYIKQADYNSRYIFRDDLDGMMKTVAAVAIVALVLNAIVLLVFALVSSMDNSRYFYVQTLLGRSKGIMCLASLMVLFVYFVLAVIAGQAMAILLAKLLGTKVASALYVIKCQMLITGFVGLVICIRFIALDLCKSQRRL